MTFNRLTVDANGTAVAVQTSQGSARHGWAGHGTVRLGMARQAREEMGSAVRSATHFQFEEKLSCLDTDHHATFGLPYAARFTNAMVGSASTPSANILLGLKKFTLIIFAAAS